MNPTYDFAAKIFLTLLMLFLGSVVLLNNRNSKVSRLYFFWVAWMASWACLSHVRMIDSLATDVRLWLYRFSGFSGAMGVVALLLFVANVTRPEVAARNRWLWLPALPAALALTPWVNASIREMNGQWALVHGPLFGLFAITVVASLVMIFVTLLRAPKSGPQALRRSHKMMLAGVGIITVFGVTVNLFFRDLLPLPRIRVLIQVLVAVMAAVTWLMANRNFLRYRIVAAEVVVLAGFSVLLARTLNSTSASDLFVGLICSLTMLLLGIMVATLYMRAEQQRLELEEAYDQLRQMDERKDAFISIASHELRTPISVLGGYVSLMQEGAYGELPAPVNEKLRTMSQMSRRIAQLIDNMLNVTRIETNNLSYKLETVDVVPLMRQAAENFRGRAAAKGLRIALDIPEDGTFRARADVEKVIAVLDNLLDNAVKYSPSGDVVLSVRRVPSRKQLLIMVQDEGIGIDQKTLPHIFEKYYRSQNPAVKAQTGTGLGLYVCALFARGMGGDILVERTGAGTGTTFAFRLPLAGEGNKKDRVSRGL